MKKVLVIAYFFPPLGGSGVQRTLKFVKYMPALNLQPLVSTVSKGHNFAYDESMLAEVPPEAEVFRSSALEMLWLRGFLERFTGRRRTESAAPGLAASAWMESNAKIDLTPVLTGPSFKQRVFNFIDDYIFIPDSKVRWLPFGFLNSLRIARREKADILFSSSYPYTVHLIALLVHKFYPKPWIADFRDPWVGNEAMQKPIAFRRKLDAWLERRVVKNADCIIQVTEPITEIYKERYPEYASKMMTITNGYDVMDFLNLEPVRQPKFTLIYTGIINEIHYDVRTFAQGVALFLQRVPEAKGQFQCMFIGYIPQPVIEIFHEYGLKEFVEVKPYMRHHECLNYLAGAQLQFLTFDQKFANAYSGKLFDYIGIGKPILAIVPEGVAAKLIRAKNRGTALELGDVEGVAAAIMHYFNEWAAGKDQNMAATGCEEFSRMNLTKRLAEVIEKLS